MPIISDIAQAVSALRQGQIIAYPTEAVYGLGCDPLNEAAVMRLLALKKRPITKGLILIAGSWEQLEPYVEALPAADMIKVLATWPGPVTWVFPATSKTPSWICGEHTTVAVRVTAHPIAQTLCLNFNRPIVSTSANVTGQAPAKEAELVNQIFPSGIDVIVAGKVGGLLQPTEIRDAVTGEVMRA